MLDMYIGQLIVVYVIFMVTALIGIYPSSDSTYPCEYLVVC